MSPERGACDLCRAPRSTCVVVETDRGARLSICGYCVAEAFAVLLPSTDVTDADVVEAIATVSADWIAQRSIGGAA